MLWRFLSIAVLAAGVMITTPATVDAEWCYYSGCCDDIYYWCQSNCEDTDNWCQQDCGQNHEYGSEAYYQCTDNCTTQAGECASECGFAWNTCTEPE
jgi:hypothetical protein